MVRNQLRHRLPAYTILALNGFEKVAFTTAGLIPTCNYRGLFLGDGQRMAQWDGILPHLLCETLGVQVRRNRHCEWACARHGGPL